jgi:hypothetical protein
MHELLGLTEDLAEDRKESTVSWLELIDGNQPLFLELLRLALNV